MKFPSLPRLIPGEDPTTKLNQWATYIEQFASSVTFEDNFEQLVVTKSVLLSTSFDVSLASLSPSQSYTANLVRMSTVGYGNDLKLVGSTIDYEVNTTSKTVKITPRVISFQWNADGEVPVRDNVLVEITVQILGVANG